VNTFENHGSVTTQGGGGYPPGGYGPPGGGGAPPPGGWGPPGGYGPPGGNPPGGYGPPGGNPPGGYGPPGGNPPGGYGPPGGNPPGGYGPPGGNPPGGYGPPGGGPPYGGGGFAPPPYQPGPPPPAAGFEATEAIAFGWAAVSKDFAGVAVPLAVAAFVASLPGIVLGGIRGGIVGALTASGSVDPTVLMLINGGGGLVNSLVSIGAQSWIMGGVVQFALSVARGQKPEFGVVFSGGRFFGPMLGATFLYSFGVVFGFALCLVPGLILLAGWLAYSAFIVDKGLGAVEALKASWQLTTPYRTNVIVYVLLSMLVGIAGALACCIGAVLVSFPVLMLGNAFVYLKLIGEQPRLPTA